MVQVPNTYFLEKAVELAMDNILARLDPVLDYEPYFLLDLGSSPPHIKHTSWDYCDMSGRCVDALILAREMTGDRRGVEAEAKLRTFLLSRANPSDGLFYNAEAPWSRIEADMFCQGRALLGLVSWFMLTGDAAVEARIEALISGLSRIAVHQEDYCFYPKDIWREGRWHDGGLWNGKMPGYSVQQLIGLTRYYEATGSHRALELAGKLARYYVYHSGAITWDGTFRGHTHSGGILPATLGVLRYALAAGDEELIMWSNRVYSYARTYTSSFGWIPDGLGLDPKSTPYACTCETCALADLIELAIKLSSAGIGDYWDDVEKFVRNHLLESQIRDVDCVIPPDHHDVEHALARQILLGSFDSASLPNALLGDPQGIVEGCCTPSGVRACCLVWSYAITQDAEGVHVNLAFNRHTPWASLISYEPYRGELQLLVHLPEHYYLRVPEWAHMEKLRIMVDGQDQLPTWCNRYLDLGTLQPGQTVVVTYPQRLAEEIEKLAGQEYVVRWKGGTVTSIAPVRENYPIYRRLTMEMEYEPQLTPERPVSWIKVQW